MEIGRLELVRPCISDHVVPDLPVGITMLEIPAGEFTMGFDTPDGTSTDDRSPAHLVSLSAFEMSETTITTEQ